MKDNDDRDRREERLDRVVAEYADALARDAAPRRDDVIARHPDLRPELDLCLDMLEAGHGPAVSPRPPVVAGTRLGDFTVLREIGRGGMGVVYEAEQAGVGRKVALKVLRHHLTIDERHVARFRREARAAGRVRHPNVVTVHAVGEQDGHLYMAMDLVRGRSLADVLVELRALGRPPSARDLASAARVASLGRDASYAEAVVRLMLPVLSGLAAAHAAGVLHRDVKPSNVLVDEGGVVRLADFGLARGDDDAGLSLTGEPLGTPFYMSPEQAKAVTGGMDARTDVYSVGATLYELLSLRVPFDGDSAIDVIRKILSSEPERLGRAVPGLPRGLESVVHKALEKDRDRRYATVALMAADLERVLADEPVEAPRPASAAQRRGQEYRSRIEILGLPLVHLASGIDPETGRPRVAKGIIAVGNVAIGVVAIGGLAVGGLTLGGMSLGVLGAIGGLAVGGIAFGGGALGLVAIGGAAVGLVAAGGGAAGYYAIGGGVAGVHTISGAAQDPEAVEFLRRWLPFLRDWF